MAADRKNLSDDELRKLLNLGDPAGYGDEPAPEELNAMRRTVLNSIDTSPAAQPWFSRSLTTAMATVAVALIAISILLQAGPWGEVLQPATGPVTPAEPAPPTTQEPPPSQTVAAVEEVPDVVVTEPSPDSAAELPAAAEESVVAEEPPALAAMEESQGLAAPSEGRQPRTVQFTAPGGTRIIWTLDPDFQLPVSEPDSQARGEL
jgi:hypothetical protein